MPTQIATSRISDSAFLDDLMAKLRNFLPLLERDETLRLLQALRGSIVQEIEWSEGLESRESALLEMIPETSEYPILLDIHTELNALEMERFIKAQSVPSLHRNCTRYRDLLIRRALSARSAPDAWPKAKKAIWLTLVLAVVIALCLLFTRK